MDNAKHFTKTQIKTALKITEGTVRAQMERRPDGAAYLQVWEGVGGPGCWDLYRIGPRGAVRWVEV